MPCATMFRYMPHNHWGFMTQALPLPFLLIPGCLATLTYYQHAWIHHLPVYGPNPAHFHIPTVMDPVISGNVLTQLSPNLVAVITSSWSMISVVNCQKIGVSHSIYNLNEAVIFNSNQPKILNDNLKNWTSQSEAINMHKSNTKKFFNRPNHVALTGGSIVPNFRRGNPATGNDGSAMWLLCQVCLKSTIILQQICASMPGTFWLIQKFRVAK